jgi:hypothetical protein
MLGVEPLPRLERDGSVRRLAVFAQCSFTQLGEDIGLKGGVGALPPARGSTPAPRPNPNP